jgi:hypothetical protein
MIGAKRALTKFHALHSITQCNYTNSLRAFVKLVTVRGQTHTVPAAPT